MKYIFNELWVSLVAAVALAALLCGIYPLLVWGISQTIFPQQANGSLLHRQDGAVVGSKLVAQNFKDPKYFHPRPSAAGVGYDATNSGGSNLGPLSKKLMDQIRDRVSAYRNDNGLDESISIPADAVTASGSGLDPQISPDNARLQASRVARARNVDVSVIQRHIAAHTQGRQFGILGEPGVNVLDLNLALDRMIP
jgi:potassium-transporting ATPase KdpC subunit